MAEMLKPMFNYFSPFCFSSAGPVFGSSGSSGEDRVSVPRVHWRGGPRLRWDHLHLQALAGGSGQSHRWKHLDRWLILTQTFGEKTWTCHLVKVRDGKCKLAYQLKAAALSKAANRKVWFCIHLHFISLWCYNHLAGNTNNIKQSSTEGFKNTNTHMNTIPSI